MYDLKNNTGIAMLMEGADKAHTDWTSNILDLQNIDAVLLTVLIGALTGVDGSNYLTLTVEESATTVDGDFTTVASSDLIGAFTVIDSTSEDSLIQKVGYIGDKRYIRVKGAYTGSSISAGIISVTSITQHHTVSPVTDPTPTAAT